MAKSILFGFNQAGKFIRSLKGNMLAASIKTLHLAGLEGEKQAKLYIINQEGALGSNPKKKVREGGSEKTLVDTSTYLQSITSEVDRTKMIAYAGVKRTKKYSNGENVANIAEIHEYGSKARNIPARPVWRPVSKSVQKWLIDSQTFYREFQKLNGRFI